MRLDATKKSESSHFLHHQTSITSANDSTTSDDISVKNLDRFPPIDYPIPRHAMPSRILTQIEKNVNNRNMSSKLSGTSNIQAFSRGLFSDSGQTISPSSLCVRCSAHASVCMKCCEFQASEALLFYRKSVGKGASLILDQAIIEAGLKTTVKQFAFNLWRNGSKTRMDVLNKLEMESVMQYNRKFVKNPFRAWRKYAKESRIQKKDDRIQELELRVKSLENRLSSEGEEKEEVLRRVILIKRILFISFHMTKDD